MGTSRSRARGGSGAPARRSPWPLCLAWLFFGGVALLWLVTRLLAERTWVTTLLLYLPQVVYAAPALITVPLALWRRDRPALLLNGATLVMIAWALMGFNVPRPAGAAGEHSPRARILAYNIEGGIEGLDGVRAQVERFRPDVVVFSEARGEGHSPEIRRQLDSMFPGWSSLRSGEVYIASRWPVAAHDAAPLGPRERIPWLNRKMMRVTVEAPFGRFHVIGVHFRTAVHGETIFNQRSHLAEYLHRTFSVREEQAADVLHWTSGLDGPVLLAGDFNTPPSGRIYSRIAARYGDSFRERGWGWGYTYPSRLPLLRIDYVFHSPEWRVTHCEVGPQPGSDHRPLFVELTWPGAGGRPAALARR